MTPCAVRDPHHPHPHPLQTNTHLTQTHTSPRYKASPKRSRRESSTSRILERALTLANAPGFIVGGPSNRGEGVSHVLQNDVQATIKFLAHLCAQNSKQVLYLQGLLPLCEDDDAFAALLYLISFTPRLWAINLGELTFSPTQQAELLASVRSSNIAFLFVDNLPLSTKRCLQKAILQNRTKVENKLWLFEHGDRQTILACELMWANPRSNNRNQLHEQQHTPSQSENDDVSNQVTSCVTPLPKHRCTSCVTRCTRA